MPAERPQRNRILRLHGILLTLMITGPTLAFEFRAPDGSALSNAIEQQFVLPMLQGSQDQVRFEWAAGDVDGDDYDELFIKLRTPGLCTDEDCPIIGFIRVEDESWRPILTAVGNALVEDEDGGLVLVSTTGRTAYRYDEGLKAMLPDDRIERAP